MEYSSARQFIKGGDIIALSHKKWGSFHDLKVQVVKIATQSDYSHVGIVWEICGRLFVIESVTPLVRIVPLSDYSEDGFYWIPLKTPMTYAETEFALAKVGKAKYSQWQAVKAFLGILKVGEDELFECAEFIICCRKLSNMSLGEIATPAAVIRNLQEQGFPVYFIEG